MYVHFGGVPYSSMVSFALFPWSSLGMELNQLNHPGRFLGSSPNIWLTSPFEEIQDPGEG